MSVGDEREGLWWFEETFLRRVLVLGVVLAVTALVVLMRFLVV